MKLPQTRTAVGVLVTLCAATFLVGAALHVGVRVPTGFGVLAEPRILPAAISETLAAFALAVGGYAVFTRKRRAWLAVVGAQAFALALVANGMVQLNAGRGPRTALNDAYHLVMVGVLAAGLVLLATRGARDALSHEP
jgi:hypothetical protein